MKLNTIEHIIIIHIYVFWLQHNIWTYYNCEKNIAGRNRHALIKCDSIETTGNYRVFMENIINN